MTITCPKAIRVIVNVTWSIYPGANGGGAGDLVNGIDNALSKGLGNTGRESGNPLGMLAMLGGLASGALKGINRFGNRFQLYRDFKENCVKKPYHAVKDRVKDALGMSDDVTKSTASSIDEAAKGGAQAAAKTAAGGLDDVARAAGSSVDDAARGAVGIADDAARAGGSALGRVGARAVPLVGVAIDGAFRYQDYKATESRYESALAQHKAGNLTDEQMADAEHLRGAAHSRNASGMAGGLIGATVTAAAVGAGVGFAAGGVGAIPGFLIGAGAGVVGYLVGDKVGTTVSDAAWGNPPSYSKTTDAVSRNTAENGVGRQAQPHDASQAWAAARQNSSYAHTGDIRTPGVVSDPEVAAKFSSSLAGAGLAATGASQPSQSDSRIRPLSRGKSQGFDPRNHSRQNSLG